MPHAHDWGAGNRKIAVFTVAYVDIELRALIYVVNRYASKLGSRCVLTTGVGTTSAGLTVTAVKDQVWF